MLAQQEDPYISEQDYLEGEKISEIKHEYVDGQVYAMTGASKNHGRISVNLLIKFSNHLGDSPCESFINDMKVKVDSKYFYPDVIVACDDNEDNEYFTESVIIIVEVLSKSTRQYDKTQKNLYYQTIPSLQEYILIEQDFVDVEVCRRENNWFSEHYYLGDDVQFNAIDLSVAVEDIYHRVFNRE
jgi:Uma2 family endonuclease